MEGVAAARELAGRAWLATLVSVEGSAWRRPGARAVLLEDGRRFGSVAGVCIDAALQQALCDCADAVAQLHTFDERLKLGCPGALHILTEPLVADCAAVFLTALEEAWSEGGPLEVATVWQRSASRDLLELGRAVRSASGARTAGCTELTEAARALLHDASPQSEYVAQSLTERWPPRTRVLLAMDASEAGPFVAQMRLLGWQCALWAAGTDAIDGADGPVFAGERADSLTELLADFDPSAVVSMTRRLSLDERVLRAALALEAVPYVGLVGSRKRCELVMDSLIQADEALAQQLSRLHAPCGLALSGEAPEAVALSIVAEIQAVLGERPAPVDSLRDQAGVLHQRSLEALRTRAP